MATTFMERCANCKQTFVLMGEVMCQDCRMYFENLHANEEELQGVTGVSLPEEEEKV